MAVVAVCMPLGACFMHMNALAASQTLLGVDLPPAADLLEAITMLFTHDYHKYGTFPSLGTTQFNSCSM